MKYEEIKAWLKKNGMSRKNFGELVGVSKSTVDNWLAGVFPIPEKKLPLILAVIERAENPAMFTPAPAHTKVSAEDFKAFPVLLTDEDYELCLRAADARGLTVSDWAADVCAEEAAAFLKKEEASRKAAAEAPTAAPPATPDPQAPPA